MKSLSRAIPNGASRRRNGEAMLVIRFVLGEIHPLDGNSCRNSVVIPQKKRTPLHFGVAFMVAGGGFEPPTFGLCDLTHLSMRVGLYLHPRGMLAIQSLRLPPRFRGLGSVLPYRSRDVGSTDFDE